MREREFPPLLANGFKDITEADLYTEFVIPFSQEEQSYRNSLLIDFGRFLNEFKSLNIKAEVWIDGSFATKAPDPSDVDVVFYFDPEEIDSLNGELINKFQRLFTERQFMRNLYKVEVHYGVKGNTLDYEQWQRTFGTYYDNIRPKGIFRIIYS